MKSYFSTIARLSGIQGLDRHAESQAFRPGKRHEVGVAPLEQETSIMVSSAGAKNETPNSIAGAQREEMNHAAMRQNHPEANAAKELSIRDFSAHAVTSDNPDIETHRDAVSTKNVSSQNATAADANGKTAQEYVARKQDIDQPALFGEPATRRAKSAQNAELTAIHTDTEAANSAVIEPLHTQNNIEYFSRTSEILTRGEADAAVVKTRVLQDVQEWVAASPFATMPAETKPHETGFMPDSMHYTAADKMPMPEQGLADKAATHTAAIEQNFELSIGTISVIVDAGEEPQRPLTPVPQQSRGVKQQNEPRFSRLDRSYL
jgi:hypothetical protein